MINEVYVLTPSCKKGPCDLRVAVQTNAGVRIGSGVFKYADGAYRLQMVRKATIGCIAEGKSIAAGATQVTRTSLLLTGRRPAGTAVVRAAITGTRTIEGEPVKANGCTPRLREYVASGEETRFAAVPVRTPTPTTRPTAQPTSGSGSGSGSGAASWAVAAQAYVDVTYDTYSTVTTAALALYGSEINPGITPEEIAVREAGAALYWKPAVQALKRHLNYMDSHPARACYKDAFSADRSLARRWLTLLQSGSYPGDLTGQGRAAADEYDDALSRTRTFLDKTNSYFTDCP